MGSTTGTGSDVQVTANLAGYSDADKEHIEAAVRKAYAEIARAFESAKKPSTTGIQTDARATLNISATGSDTGGKMGGSVTVGISIPL